MQENDNFTKIVQVGPIKKCAERFLIFDIIFCGLESKQSRFFAIKLSNAEPETFFLASIFVI